MQALGAFGAPLDKIAVDDFAQPEVVYQIGVPPGRIDILTELTGVAFSEAWPDRIEQEFGSVRAPFIGREAFVRNKRATKVRTQDLADVEALE